MVDDLTPQDPTQQAPVVPGAEPPDAPAPEQYGGGPSKGFFSTTAGKIAIIVGALFALMIVAGLAIGVFFLFFAGEVVDDFQQTIEGSVAATATPSGEVEPTEPGEIALSNIYTFRNIFEPLIDEPVEEVEEVEGEEEIPSLEENTLFLQDIVVEDGVSKAVLIWNDSRYVLAEGEIISGTPWQVLSVGTEAVTMLFGDEQVVLIVGQGIVVDAPPPVDK